jgi:hypothetical protein
MAASCSRSVFQFAMAFFQCDQNDDERSFQDVNVSDGNVLMMLTAVSTKRAGTTIECSLPPSIISLAPRRLLVYSQQDAPWLSLFCKLYPTVSCIQKSPTSSLLATVKPGPCKTVLCRHGFRLNNGLLLSDFRFYLKVYCRANAWRCITILLPSYRIGSCFGD